MPASHVEERPFALRRTAAYEFIEGLNRTKEALREQGFDIVTTYDTRAERSAAPAPSSGSVSEDLLRRAIEADPEAGVFLPCSVAVRESGEGIVVEAVDPRATLGRGSEALAAIAIEVRERLVKALDRLPPGGRR